MSQFSSIISVCIALAVSNGILATNPNHYLLYKSELVQLNEVTVDGDHLFHSDGTPIFDLPLSTNVAGATVIIAIALPNNENKDSIEAREERFKASEHLKLIRWASLYHKKHKVHVMFYITANQKTADQLLSVVFQDVGLKYKFEDSNVLRSISFGQLDTSDLATSIKEMGDLWALPMEPSTIAMISYDHLWLGSTFDPNGGDDEYVANPAWLATCSTDEDTVSSTLDSDEKPRQVKQVWAVAAKLDPSQMEKFKDLSFDTYVRQIAEMKKFGIRVILLISSTGNKDVMPMAALMVRLNEKLRDEQKAIYVAYSFHWGQTGALPSTDVEKFSTFNYIFNGHFNWLKHGPQSIPTKLNTPTEIADNASTKSTPAEIADNASTKSTPTETADNASRKSTESILIGFHVTLEAFAASNLRYQESQD